MLVKIGNWLTGLTEKVCGWDVAPRATWLLRYVATGQMR